MVNEVIEQFFTKWESEWFEWFKQMKEERNLIGTNDFNNKYRDSISKENRMLIAQGVLYPRQGCGMSIQEIVKRDMQGKKIKLYRKVMDKVGTVTEVNLYCGEDGTPNGTVEGTKGMVTISTITAGGYNIQCLHYRVLVK
jgi:hypothetical protein